jgi:hypothetical protein
MSKSIVVVNTPKTCVDCIFCQEFGIGSRKYACCYVTNGDSENDMKLIDCIYGYCQSKPDWCPLKPLPEKSTTENDMTDYQCGMVDGRNQYIDEIAGGGESDD